MCSMLDGTLSGFKIEGAKRRVGFSSLYLKYIFPHSQIGIVLSRSLLYEQLKILHLPYAGARIVHGVDVSRGWRHINNLQGLGI